MANPPRSFAIIASVIWIVVAVPFFYLAYLHRNRPASWFVDWRGWVFFTVAVLAVLMATVVPPRYRIAIVATRLRGWGRLI